MRHQTDRLLSPRLSLISIDEASGGLDEVFGSVLTMQRRSLGLSRSDVARLADVPRATVARLEEGALRAVTSPATAERVVRLLAARAGRSPAPMLARLASRMDGPPLPRMEAPTVARRSTPSLERTVAGLICLLLLVAAGVWSAHAF